MRQREKWDECWMSWEGIGGEGYFCGSMNYGYYGLQQGQLSIETAFNKECLREMRIKLARSKHANGNHRLVQSCNLYHNNNSHFHVDILDPVEAIVHHRLLENFPADESLG